MMRRLSLSLTISHRLVRDLSNTATTTTVAPSQKTIPPGKLRWMIEGEQDSDKAIELYSSIPDTYFNPTICYAKHLIVKRLVKAQRFQDVEAFINSHKNHPKITDEPFFANLVRSYGQAGMFDNAVELYGQMEELGVPRSVVSFNALLYAAYEAKLFDRVADLFVEMPERHGFKPNEVSYGVLIRSYCDKGDTEMGLKVFREMGEKGVKVATVSLSMLYSALCKNSKKDEAERVWGEVVDKECKPDVAAWNVRIAQEVLPETVNGLIDQMSAAGLKPDLVSYNHLLSCYCSNDRFDEAMKIFGELQKNKFKPNVRTYKIMISYMCKKKDYAKGYGMFKMSAKYRRMPDFDTIKELVEGMVKKKMRNDAERLISTVKNKFPATFLDAWKKVEADLGLVSDETPSANEVPEAQVAAK